jgi:hypothetical protein
MTSIYDENFDLDATTEAKNDFHWGEEKEEDFDDEEDWW